MDFKNKTIKIKTKIMKTNEQIKKELVSYLTKTSKHVFYNEESKTLFQVTEEGGVFYEQKNGGLKSTVTNLDSAVTYYGANAKNVIKHRLFLDKGYKSIKRSALKHILNAA